MNTERPFDDERHRVWAIAYMARLQLLARGDIIRQSCIASTKVTLEVLRELGVLARPMICSVQAFNKPMADRLDRGEVPTADDAWTWWEEDGSWSVGVQIQDPPQPGALGAHLVAIVQRSLLVDASLDQMDRPQRGIRLGPSVFGMPDEQYRHFMDGGQVAVTDNEGTVIVYVASPMDRRFQESKDWVLWQERYGTLAADIVDWVRRLESGEADPGLVKKLAEVPLPSAPDSERLAPGPPRPGEHDG